MVIFDVGVWSMLLGIFILIALDAILGAVLALQNGVFDFRVFPQFLKTNCPYLIVPTAFAFATLAKPEYIVFFYSVCALITIKFSIESLYDKVKLIFTPVAKE